MTMQTSRWQALAERVDDAARRARAIAQFAEAEAL